MFDARLLFLLQFAFFVKFFLDLLGSLGFAQIAFLIPNALKIKIPYKSRSYQYLYAITDAMSEEYQRSVEAGSLLQIDDPRLVIYYGANLGLSLRQCLE